MLQTCGAIDHDFRNPVYKTTATCREVVVGYQCSKCGLIGYTNRDEMNTGSTLKTRLAQMTEPS